MSRQGSQGIQKSEINSDMISELPTKRHKSGGLNTIEVPVPNLVDTNPEFQTITDPILIEKIILQCQFHHLRQAENTLLAGSATIDSIGFEATTTTVDESLKGTADIDTITDDPTSRQLFDIFKTSKPELKTKITEENIMHRYKRWNERTATSPSGRHLCYYYALF